MAPARRSPASFLARLTDLRPGEGPAVAWGFLYFFSLLTGYYVLRPVREEMGIRGGVSALPWLFTVTFAAMLVAVPLYSSVVARFPRRRIVPVVYRFFLLNLLAFWGLLAAGAGGQAVARAFYVWTAVYNLFVVSVFWSVLADVFASEHAKRLFGFIAAGGTAGALLGPVIAGSLAGVIGPVNLLLLSAVFLEASVACVRRLFRAAPRTGRSPPPAAIGGSSLQGLADAVRSPFLRAISLQTLLFACVSTFIYLQQQGIVAGAIGSSAGRTRLFAAADLLVNLIALGLQTLATGAVLSRLGLFAGLASVPLLGAVGAGTLALAPSLPGVVALSSVRRGVHFGLERPARETLFTAVGDAERYKAKAVVDTLVYRGADAASGWLHAGLQAVGLSAPQVLTAAVPLALGGLGVAGWLSREYRARTASGARAGRLATRAEV